MVDETKCRPTGKNEFKVTIERVGTDDGVVRTSRQFVDKALVAGLVEGDDRSSNVSFEHIAKELIEVTSHLGVDSAEAGDGVATEPLRHAEVVQHDISVLSI